MQVVISHSSADFDSLAAMVAATKLYPGAVIVLTGSPDQHVREFMSLHKEWIPVFPVRDINMDLVTRIIVVDTREASRLGEFRNLVNRPNVELHIYDHHPTSYKDLVGDLNVVEEVGSTTTVLVKQIRSKKIPITSLDATLFILGIYIDTGCLTFPTTTVTDVKCAAWLLENGASLALVSAHIHETLSSEQRQLLTSLINAATHYHLHGFDILLTSANAPQFIDNVSLLTHKLMDLERMDAVFSVVAMRDRIHIIGRSNTAGIDVNEILSFFGGGGHATAASANVRSLDVDGYCKKLWEVVVRKVRPLVTARDMMSRPVHSITPDTSIGEAQQILLRFGHSGILVMDANRLVGTISRRDLDRAVHHGYGHSPVHAYMSRNLIVATPDTPLPDLQRLMVEHDIGRIPVLDKGDIAGIVTRTDVIRTLGGGGVRKPILSSFLRIEEFHLLPAFARELLHEIGEVGDTLKISVFVVGGFVRDLLLGMPSLDIDIVVEGDGIAFARTLAARKEARVRQHEKFGTAVVIFPSGFKIDIATARSEFYARPAALPEVVGTSIKQDLYRRDFSINAIAIKLNPSDFGSIIDFFSGQRDLQHGVIRILHNLSFLEDPTRIFRAVRFEQRYHFRMEYTTERLLTEAVHSGVFEKIAYERVRDELILILSEENPLPALKRMAKLKILPLLHSKLHLDNKVIGILEQIHKERFLFKTIFDKEKVEFWMVYFLGLSAQLSERDAAEMSQKLKLSQPHSGIVVYDRIEFAQFKRRLNSSTLSLSSQVVKLLDPLPLEWVLLLYAISNSSIAKERISEYLSNGRKLKLFLNGGDILKLGVQSGPRVKEILESLKAAQLDRLVLNKKEALEFIRKIIHHE